MPEKQLPSPNLGWTRQNNIWVPKWTTLSGIAKYCLELQKCGCIKSQCTGNATVQAFHAQQCDHVAVKKTNKIDSRFDSNYAYVGQSAWVYLLQSQFSLIIISCTESNYHQ